VETDRGSEVHCLVDAADVPCGPAGRFTFAPTLGIRSGGAVAPGSNLMWCYLRKPMRILA
jgi:hypothetical protein